VAQCLVGVRLPKGPAFDLVTSWCETASDGVGSISGDHGGTFPVVTATHAISSLDEDSICRLAGVDDEVDLTEELVAYAICRRLRELLGEGEFVEDLPPAGCEIIIEASNCDRASLCFYLTGGFAVFDGPEFERVGVYPNLESFRVEHSARGMLTQLAELDALTNQQLLASWRARPR
jgi:hypothetical protein